MDAPLQDCTIEEHGIVRFLCAGGVKPVEIHSCMLARYGQSTISQRKVYEWVERFKSGQTRCKFTSDEEVKEAVHIWFREQPKKLLHRNTETN
jgi:hypothetical protein